MIVDQKLRCVYLQKVLQQKGQYQKLGSITFQPVDESMNNEDNFVTAWKKLAIKPINVY